MQGDVHPQDDPNECDQRAREFIKLKINMASWCDRGRTQRLRVGSLTDKALKSSKTRAAEASLDKVAVGSDPPLENVPNFQYLGSRLQGDGSDEADVRHRLEIAKSAFCSLSHLWTDHRLSRTTKLRLYRVCVCSSLKAPLHDAIRPHGARRLPCTWVNRSFGGKILTGHWTN